MRLKYLSKTIVVNNARIKLHEVKKWIEDKSKERKLSEYKTKLEELRKAINAVPVYIIIIIL